MKNTLFMLGVVATLLLHVNGALAQWTRLTPVYPASLRLSDVAVNGSHIFAVGYRFSDFQGHIFRSFNNGVTWDSLQLPPAGFLFETIAFKDTDTAFIGGFGSLTIWLHTTDGGNNWAYHSIDTTTKGINDMVFLDDKRGFAGGYDTVQFYSGNCYYTEDGGNNWKTQTVDTGTCLDTLGLDYISFPDVQTGFAVSNFGLNKYLLKTTDTGKHWNIIYTQPGIGGIYFWNVYYGIIVAGGGKIFKTTDGGITWVPKTSPTTAPLFSVSFINNNIGYAVGGNGVILKTVDAGETWTNESSPTTQHLFRVKCFNGLAYATGEGGTVLRSTPVAGFSPLPLAYKLNVYPNPASSILNISSTTNHHFSRLSVTLTDATGHTVKTATTTQTLIQLDINNLPAGIYTVVVDADGQKHTENISITH